MAASAPTTALNIYLVMLHDRSRDYVSTVVLWRAARAQLLSQLMPANVNGLYPNRDLSTSGARSTKAELVEWCNKQGRKHGIDPDPDEGPGPGTNYVCTLANFGR